jgi:hypothetical protein
MIIDCENDKMLCNSLNKSKSYKLIFPKSISKTLELINLIHNDIWGLAPCNSVIDFRFYIVFIDDFSRYTWLFPLKYKFDTFTIFKKFKALVEN